MKKKLLALVLAAIMILGFMPQSAKADNSPNYSATVYLSISNDAEYVNTASTNGYEGNQIAPTVMAMKQITVPYFDLHLYGLDDYYFSSEDYGPDPGWPGDPEDPDYPLPPKSNLTPGTAAYAGGIVTMLHVFIYAMEVYYYGVPESLAGKGWMYQHNKLGTTDINITGTVGSLYFLNYWGLNYNFNYYRNYNYPLASSGWGATVDQVRVYDGDILTIGHFTDMDFFDDPYSIFGYAQPSYINLNTTDAVSKLSLSLDDPEVTLVFGHAGIDYNTFTGTAHTAFNTSIPVYYKAVGSIITGTVTNWSQLGSTTASGAITIDPVDLGVGTYFVAMPGRAGAESSAICCTPGGILIEITE